MVCFDNIQQLPYITGMVYGLDQNPMEVIETGDYVQVDGNRGMVVVTKKR